MSELVYKQVAGSEVLGGRLGAVGIHLSVATKHEIPYETILELDRLTKSAEKILYAGLMKSGEVATKNAEEAAKERAGLIEVFSDTPIYVQAIPNGYCSEYCCKHLPWFYVTTKIGHIMIGWRKRVIVVDWTSTEVKASAEELFPNETVTKHDQLIHAWSYDDARQYVEKIIKAGERP